MALVYDPVTGRMVETNSATTPRGVGLQGAAARLAAAREAQRGTATVQPTPAPTPAPAPAAPAAPPVGIGLTPEQQAAQRRAQQQQAMADRITETRENVGGAFRQAVRSVADSNPVSAGVRFAQNTTFDDRLPGQADREAARARQESRRNAQWVADNPAEAQAAQQFGQDVVERARVAGLTPPGGYPGLSAPALQPTTAGAGSDGVPMDASEVDRIAAITAAAQQPAALDVAGLNRNLADTITASRPEAPIYQPQVRGDYNMYNTDQGALAARAAPTAGINFGFGVGGAPTAGEYLATMQARDAQEARATQQRRAAAQAAIERSRYAQQMTGNNPFERRAARELLQGLDQRENLGVTEAGATGRQQMQGDASRDVAGIQGQLGVTQAGVQAQGGVEQQRIASEQRAQQAAAMLAQDQAQFEMDPSNQRGAIIAQLAQAMLQEGDTQGAVSALYGTQPAAPARPDIKMVQGPTGETIGVTVNGVPQPFTPEEIAALVQAQQAYRVPVQ